MPDLHYEHPALAALYDNDSGWSADRDFYLALATGPALSILDLGCGTGLLCNAYAALGHRVTGVDPAQAMLNVARQKPHGPGIVWVHSTGQEFQSVQRFDLILMTGHAFQVLLERDDRRAVFDTVRQHLAPGGVFVFESRNPGIDWATRWNTDLNLNTAAGPVLSSRRILWQSGNRIGFETRYVFADQALVSVSELVFPSDAEIRIDLAACGLRVCQFFGGWAQEEFSSERSAEMVFVVGA